MESLTQSQTWLQNSASSLPLASEKSVDRMIQDLLQEYLRLWWRCERSFPTYDETYTSRQHAQNDSRFDGLVSGLLHELKHMPASAIAREEWQARLRPELLQFAATTLHLEERHMAYIETSGILPAMQQFARMARQFDPTISADDIYQAGRNVMTANFIQLLFGLPVEVTPSIFAYSMLYPYTDNYLDDPAISTSTKLAFNERFRSRLQGHPVMLNNPYEVIINRLIEQIESQWDRSEYPRVYESLLAIHAAQSHSLHLNALDASPFELDILGISFEKGATSVLADGYLVAGDLSLDQARLLFGFGVYTQLIDDLEDLYPDQKEGRQSVFSQTAPHWALDRVTNQFIHLGRSVLSNLSVFPGPDVPILQELTTRCIDPVLIDIIARAGKGYTKNYLRDLQSHLPYTFDSVKKQREKFSRQKINMEKLFTAFLC
jgi:hypothetical protein